jgi:uncharacterized membrane protein
MIFAIVLLGLANGCRTMMPIAVLCWFAYTGHLPVEGTWGFWTSKLVSVILFTILAAGELIGDKLPKTPNRTAALPLVARFLFGGTVGAIVAASLSPGMVGVGALVGGVSALAGAFAGFYARRGLTTRLGLPDLPVALVEDIVVVGASVFALHLVGR